MPRRRSETVLLAAVLAANFVGLTLQVRLGIGVPLRDGLVMAFAGGQDLISRASRSASRWFESLGDTRRLRTDRDALAARVAELEWQLTLQRGLFERTRAFPALEETPFATLDLTPAEIIGASASPLDATVTVNRGSLHGVAGNSAALGSGGIVGRVVAVGPTASQVHLLTGPGTAVAALTEKGRVRGIVRARSGAGAGEAPLLLDYVPGGRQVEVGELVVTSGLEGIYPKGLRVGRVARVMGGAGMLLDIGVEPTVDFGTLEWVLLASPAAAAAFSGPGETPPGGDR